jgi:hypothetical protein
LEEVGVSNAKMGDTLNPHLRQEYMRDATGRMQNIAFARQLEMVYAVSIESTRCQILLFEGGRQHYGGLRMDWAI